jgi:hypothetical protein
MLRNHGRRVAAAIGAALATAALVSACGGGSSSPPTPTAAGSGKDGNAGQTTAAPTKTKGRLNAGGEGQQPTLSDNAAQSDFNPKSFGDPTASTNRWLPLKPGTQWVREGFVNVGSRRLPHRVVTTVTDVTKQVDGVRTVAVLDQDFNGGQLSEQSIDYLADDRSGNVWYLGSYTESYEGGQFVFANDAWLSGVNGAKAGVLMIADPQTGTPAFTEDTVPGVEAPTAQVSKTGLPQCVPFKCYKDALLLLEGGESKYFAPGVGQIKLSPPAGGGAQEVENLVNLTQLSPGGLRQISNEVLKLDKHSRTEAPTVFANAAAASRTL